MEVAEQNRGIWSSRIPAAVRLLDATRKATVACERPDLLQRVDDAQERLRRSDMPTVVIGEFKQGKSSLINALLNAPVCPVDDDIATALLTIVHHADRPRAVAFADDETDDARTVAVPIELAAVPDVVLAGMLPDRTTTVRTVEFGLPRRLLADGMQLVDTPGVGLESAQGKATLSLLPIASAVVFVTDASQELTASELEALTVARDRCSNLVCVVSKTDLYPKWRQIVEANRRHLHAAGLSCPVIPLSSTLRSLSVELDDRELHEESGFPALVRYLKNEVIGQADRLRVRTAAEEISTVVEQLSHTVDTERVALADPTVVDRLIEQAEATEERASELRAATAQWNTTLNDGISDLNATVDHDLRVRMRAIVAEFEALLDENDPTDILDDLLPTVEERLMTALAENHELIRVAALELADSVTEIFEQEAPSMAPPPVPAAPDAMDGVGALEIKVDDRPSSLGSVLTAMRGSYGGMVMFGGLVGIAGNLVSVAALGPLGLAVGAALGRKAAAEERKRQLTQRRQQAKQSIKRHVDSVTLSAAKKSKDTVRAVQRELRDTHLRRAKELSTTAAEQARAARRSAEASKAQGAARLAKLDRMAEGLAVIRNGVLELTAGS